MTITQFPPVEYADEDGLLAVGGDLEVDSLLLAYSSGIFPWPIDEEYLTWFAPPQRAVLFLDELHISTSLKKARRKSKLQFKVNNDFESVIRNCALSSNRKEGNGTWITEDIIAAYLELNAAGYGYSFEAYEDNELAGGIYGVKIDQMFAAESMFYKKTDASKLTLCFLVDWLKEQGSTWLDCQVLNPFLETLGIIEVPRNDFMKMLKSSLKKY